MLREMISGVMRNYESASYMRQQKARIFLFLEWIIFILVVLVTRQSDEQHRGIEDIRASITQMDLVVQENSALVERTSAVSDTLSRQARDLMSMLQGKNAANGKAAMLS